jgi:N-acetylneuraminic acid mutarotase
MMNMVKTIENGYISMKAPSKERPTKNSPREDTASSLRLNALIKEVEEMRAFFKNEVSELRDELRGARKEIETLATEREGLTRALTLMKVISRETVDAAIHREGFERACVGQIFELRLHELFGDLQVYRHISEWVGIGMMLPTLCNSFRVLSKKILTMTVAPPMTLYCLEREDKGHEDEMPMIGVRKMNIQTQRNWEETAPVPTGRRNFSVAVAGTYLYVAGGWSPVGSMTRVHDTVQRYDPRLKKWETIEPMLQRRSSFTLFASGGYLYALGGKTMADKVLKSVERLDTRTGLWSGLGEMNSARVKAKVVELDGDLYVVGGEVNVPWFERRMDRFNRLTGLFHTVYAPMNSGRSNHGLCAHNGAIWALGGWGPEGAEVLRSCERYRPDSDGDGKGAGEWTQCPPMRVARYGMAAVSYEGNIYAVGGEGSDCRKLSSVERFDEASRDWEYVRSMSAPRSMMYSFVMQDSIYIFGGGIEMMNKKHVEDGEYYRASTNRWNKLGRATISNPILHIARAVW